MLSKKVSRGVAALKTRMGTIRRPRAPSALEAESSDSLTDAVDSDDAPEGMPMSASMKLRMRNEYPGLAQSELDSLSAPRKRRATIAFRARRSPPPMPASDDDDDFQLADPTAPSSVDLERVRMSERVRMRRDIFTSENDSTVELVPAAPIRSLVVEQLEHAAERELIRRDIFTSEGEIPRMTVRATANVYTPQYSQSYGYLGSQWS